MDAAKLLAFIPETEGGRLIVTIVTTFHFDKISIAEGQKRADYLTDRGFPKSSVQLSKADSRSMSASTAELRET